MLKEGRQSDQGKPERAAAQLILQHNVWEPQHVRRQAQDADVPKFFLVPLKPVVYPALEAERNVSSGLCCGQDSLTPPTYPEGKQDRV